MSHSLTLWLSSSSVLMCQRWLNWWNHVLTSSSTRPLTPKRNHFVSCSCHWSITTIRWKSDLTWLRRWRKHMGEVNRSMSEWCMCFLQCMSMKVSCQLHQTALTVRLPQPVKRQSACYQDHILWCHPRAERLLCAWLWHVRGGQQHDGHHVRRLERRLLSQSWECGVWNTPMEKDQSEWGTQVRADVTWRTWVMSTRKRRERDREIKEAWRKEHSLHTRRISQVIGSPKCEPSW